MEKNTSLSTQDPVGIQESSEIYWLKQELLQSKRQLCEQEKHLEKANQLISKWIDTELQNSKTIAMLEQSLAQAKSQLSELETVKRKLVASEEARLAAELKLEQLEKVNSGQEQAITSVPEFDKDVSISIEECVTITEAKNEVPTTPLDNLDTSVLSTRDLEYALEAEDYQDSNDTSIALPATGESELRLKLRKSQRNELNWSIVDNPPEIEEEEYNGQENATKKFKL